MEVAINEGEVVTVYDIWIPAASPERRAMSSFTATREAILREPGGDVIEATAEEVEVTLLNSLGQYQRLATGWGDLP